MDEAQRGLITLFDKEGVNYLVIGGFAILAHGINRETHDLDIWVRASRQNAKRVARGFERLGKRAPRDDWVTLFRESGRRFAYPNDDAKQADILTSLGDMDFDSCFNRSVIVDYHGDKLRVMSIEDLIQSKRVSLASGNNEKAHARDQGDLDTLLALSRRLAGG